ncbi:MAG: mechanosensitive ion channel family protein [Elusimicrobia bacterium]|nr:mechanosensitive ion channel family protein [Elusimicrobiota bacterium]
MDTLRPYLASFMPWCESTVILVVSALAARVCRTTLLRRLEEWIGKDAAAGQLTIHLLRKHVPAWILLAGVSAAVHTSPLAAFHQALLDKAVLVFFFVSITFAASSLVSDAIDLYAASYKAPSAALQVTSNLSQILIVALGGMLLLSNLGISITPLLTALGVSSLAVALALQDTLTNFFAGIHIVASDIADVGDHIRLETGQEGVVVEIGWRATRIRELANNHIMVPNMKLAQSIVVNYQRPLPDIGVSVPMQVAFDADLGKVEAIALDVAAAVLKSQSGGVASHPPSVRFTGFAETGIQFSVNVRASSFPDKHLIVHELVKRSHERFRKEGIAISYPQKTVTVKPG